MRHIAKAACIVATLVVFAVPATAGAVERSSPFTDYRQAVADQYGTPPGQAPAGGQAPAAGQAPALAGNTPLIPTGTPAGGQAPENAGAGPAGGQAPDNAAGDVRRGGDQDLPFTGLDLLTLVLLGAGLVALGMLVRALMRARRRLGLARPLG